MCRSECKVEMVSRSKCELHVRGIAGPICKIIITSTDTGSMVKLEIERETGIHPVSQRLICGVREVLDKECICGLQPSTDVPVDVLLVQRTQQQVTWLQQLKFNGWAGYQWSSGWARQFFEDNPEAANDYSVARRR